MSGDFFNLIPCGNSPYDVAIAVERIQKAPLATFLVLPT
jgi:hypothetical protein